MVTRIVTALTLAAALSAAPLRVSARSCIIYDAPIQKSCHADCCANKTCCATSPKKTAPAAEPLAKSAATQDLNATSMPLVSGIVPPTSTHLHYAAGDRGWSGVSPPRLALLCTILI
jgi:hypothetical protein